MATKVLLVTGDRRVREHLGHLLGEAEDFELAGAVRDGTAARSALERDPDVTIVVVDESVDEDNGHAAARSIGATFPLVGLVMVVGSVGPEQMARAMDVGARSVISTATGLDEVIARLEAVGRWADSVRSALDADFTSQSAGRVVAIAGAKGGVGASTIALLLARASVGVRSVTVVDFDLGKGDLAAYAGVHTRRSIVDLSGVAGEITNRMLRETSYELSGGLRLLSAPAHGERGEELTPSAARSIIAALRYESELAIIDVGSHLDEVSATVLEFADAALVVATPDLPALRATRRVLEQWERLAIRQPANVELVLNRRAKQDQITPQLAERIVERPLAFTVPDGGTAFEEAMNTATLFEVNTPVHEAVARAGEEVLAKDPATAQENDQQEGDDELEKLLTKSAPTTRRARREGKDKKRDRRKEKAQAGQAAVELPVFIGLALLVLLMIIQGIGWAAGLVAARSAAQDGARTVGLHESFTPAVEQQARQDALDGLLAWHDGAVISVGAHEVRVEINAFTVLPGVNLTAGSTAPVHRED